MRKTSALWYRPRLCRTDQDETADSCGLGRRPAVSVVGGGPLRGSWGAVPAAAGSAAAGAGVGPLGGRRLRHPVRAASVSARPPVCRPTSGRRTAPEVPPEVAAATCRRDGAARRSLQLPGRWRCSCRPAAASCSGSATALTACTGRAVCRRRSTAT